MWAFEVKHLRSHVEPDGPSSRAHSAGGEDDIEASPRPQVEHCLQGCRSVVAGDLLFDVHQCVLHSLEGRRSSTQSCRIWLLLLIRSVSPGPLLHHPEKDDRRHRRHDEDGDLIDTSHVGDNWNCYPPGGHWIDHPARMNKPSMVRSTMRISMGYCERTAAIPRKSARARSWASTTPAR